MVEQSVEPSFESEFGSFLSGLLGSEPAFKVERELLVMSGVTLAAALFVFALWFLAYLSSPGSLSLAGKYAPYMIYAVLSSVGLTAAVAHYFSHRTQFTCMEGMMVGMTIGMMGGFLFGSIVGATNGIFVGSVFGMVVGMAIGAWCGKCCGIMGVMEGMMAGLMGGLMGAMVSVMMSLDHLALFMPLLVISCLSILFGLTYMIHSTAGKRQEEKSLIPMWQFALASVVLMALTFIVVLFAPRSLAVVL